MPNRYRITVAYDGTAYGGWQIQPNAPTVQAAIEGRLKTLAGADVKIHGSGRTDQGVHARGQVAHFDLERPLPPAALTKGLNALLPPDIRVLSARRAAPAFHARRSARSKEYRYFIWNDAILPPHARLYHAHVRPRLDVAAMNAAAGHLIGRHDFAAFTANPNRVVESPVRTLARLRVTRRGRAIVVVAAGDGFLYKMVRSLCGLLIRVGEGALRPDAAREILASRVRTARVPTAPPEGLFLWRVSY